MFNLSFSFNARDESVSSYCNLTDKNAFEGSNVRLNSKVKHACINDIFIFHSVGFYPFFNFVTSS